jgi:hypothetical protein
MEPGITIWREYIVSQICGIRSISRRKRSICIEVWTNLCNLTPQTVFESKDDHWIARFLSTMDATFRTKDNNLEGVHQAETETRNVERGRTWRVTTAMATFGYRTPWRIETRIDWLTDSQATGLPTMILFENWLEPKGHVCCCITGGL